MPSTNTVILAGHLTRDIEIRTSQKGNQWCRFSLGINEEGGDKSESASFPTCVVFGGNAEKLVSAKKGDAVHVVGKLKTGSYEKDGVKHYTTDVQVSMLHWEPRKSKGDYAPPAATQPAAQKPLPQMDPDEIPF